MKTYTYKELENWYKVGVRRSRKNYGTKLGIGDLSQKKPNIVVCSCVVNSSPIQVFLFEGTRPLYKNKLFDLYD